MSIDQFDKLKRLANNLIEHDREAKFKIARLEQENLELRERLETLGDLPANSADMSLENLLVENEKLKKKNELVKKSLGEIVTRLEPRLR